MKVMNIITVGLALSFSLSAMADQCIWISRDEATRAANVIKPGMRVRNFCAPCGDILSSGETVNSITTRPAVDFEGNVTSYFEVVVNGEAKDLAYLFIESNGQYLNVAQTVECSNLDESTVPNEIPR